MGGGRGKCSPPFGWDVWFLSGIYWPIISSCAFRKSFWGAIGPFLGVYNGVYRLGVEYFILGTSNPKALARELLPNIRPYKYQRLILLTNRERENRSCVNGLPSGYTPLLQVETKQYLPDKAAIDGEWRLLRQTLL